MCDTAKNSELAIGAGLAEPSPQQLGSSVTRSRYPKCKTNFKDQPLFVDSTFPTEGMEQSGLKWKRPKEICPTAQFIIDDASRMDVCQGDLNDCWFLSAVASLSLHRHLLERVIPKGQSFQEGYTGCFVFRFWQYGEWQEVKIDDFLPTRNGQLVFLRCSRKDEFWSPLLEKAYAKLKGGYGALDMGLPHEAMLDMTGGVTQAMSIMMLPMDLVSFLQPLLRKGTLINCASFKGPFGQKNEFGIIFRHAYSLTGVEKVRTKFGHVDLVRVHNPWGMGEWLGPWSDINGPEWRVVSEEEQRRLSRVSRDDGEFWMSVPDFRQHFDSMELCHLHDGVLSELGSSRRPWHCTVHYGRWERSRTAGGQPNGGWFWQNPQFALTLLKEDSDNGGVKPTCTFLVALMQKQKRRTAAKMGLNVHIYQARSDCSFLSSLDFTLQQPLLSLQQYNPRAEVVLSGHLAPGNYIIIPSMAEANREGEFMLRILTEKGNTAVPTGIHRMVENLPTEVKTAQLAPPREPLLPAAATLRMLFKKHCNSVSAEKKRCGALQLLNLLKEVIGEVLAGYEKGLCLELCKSFVALMDSNVSGQLDWEEFHELWKRFRKWTDIFVKADKNNSQSLDYMEIGPALKAAGLWVDEFLMQLIGLRYTEPDNTVSYFGFLYLLLKLDSTISKFNTYDMVGMGTVSLNFRQWLHLTMYN
ncbi:calpain-9 isoform X1 [Anguilla anguilla]|uniref:calpain-9 isoform X1 n=1 Tax=Anguilla anguilla TaxID=7936 RepID=UPI0015AC8FD4|nr:calpain-9 isoform X1 [Anguilla anguilla]